MTVPRTLLALLIGGVFSPINALSAQDFEGRVLVAETGEPIAGAVVQILGVGLVRLTDAEGRFEFPDVGVQADSVAVSRYGYATLRTAIDFSSAVERTFELRVDPVLLEGISTEIPFERRLEILNYNLDLRVGEWPGRARVADLEDLRAYDEEWESDPYRFLHYGPLKMSWAGETSSGRVRLYSRGYGFINPEVWIDDRQVWLQVFLETPNESLCRVETYTPKRFTLQIQPTAQLRAYTCGFLARAAMGMEEVCPNLQWGRLIAGPGGSPSLRASEREGSRPPGTPTPIDLGPGLDLSAATIGVGSAACR